MSEYDDLLDNTLDDLEDLPEYKILQPGAHRLNATFSQKEIGDKKAIELELTLIETLELADPNNEPDKVGTQSSTLFFIETEFGRGKLKKIAAPFSEALGYRTIREIVDNVKDVECVAVTTQRKDKKDPDKVYLNISEIQVA